MTTSTGDPPLDLPRLRDQIRALFSDSELRDLCLDLGIDYEELPGAAKSDKVRELVQYMERRDRLDDLMRRVIDLRPHVGLNVQRLAERVAAADADERRSLRSLMDQFRRYNEQMVEWKELHNRLNVLLNVFDSFGTQVERIDAREERIDPRMLQLAWQSVYQTIYQLLLFGRGIRHIGLPYNETEQAITGAEWAVEMASLRAGIQAHLQRRPATLLATYDNDWWQTLREDTSRLDDAIKRYLFLADEELRKTAGDLYDLSAESLWSVE
jgi:hypothetical protein